jgi:twitching motility protein PilT
MKIKIGENNYVDLHQLMIDYKASDLYVTFDEHPTMRVNNSLHRLTDLPIMTDELLKELMDSLVKPEFMDYFNKNMSIDLWVSDHGRRYRINISKQQWHIMIVSRLLMETPPTVDQLWLPSVLKELASKTSGIILVAWPTGCGKSTTLASMIQEINLNYSKHIITLEDPIEYKFKPEKCIVEQKELGKDITWFASSSKFTLRQRPDVILLGELREVETIRNAILLAETGHLLLASIHSRSSIQTLNKIIGAFPAEQQNLIRTQLSENLLAIISQKLIKTLDWKSVVVAMEIMINNSAIENMIRENKMNTINNTILTNRRYGMQLMEEELINLVAAQKISAQDAINNANDPLYVSKELINRWIVKK